MTTLLHKFLGEIVGTFLFIILILIITSKLSGAEKIALPIGFALALCILLFGNLTGGHFNPAVSFTMFIKDPAYFTSLMLLTYIIAQLIGGVLALKVYNLIKNKI